MYILAALKTLVPSFMAGFLVFGVLDNLSERLGLLRFAEVGSDHDDNEGDDEMGKSTTPVNVVDTE